MYRFWTFSARRHCPHSNLSGIYGDEINAVGGFRLRCRNCGRLLNGPVTLARMRYGEELEARY